MIVDDSTPVLVGVGQASDPIDADDYRAWSAADLGAAAAQRALDDAGADPSVIDVIGGVRQFETSFPGAAAPLGRSSSFPLAVAARLGSSPRRAVLEVVGGQSPQHLVSEMARAIAAGETSGVLLVGAEAISTARHLAGRADAPDFAEDVDGETEDRGYGLEGMMSTFEAAHGLTNAPAQYALLEHARREARGVSRDELSRSMGALFAPFTTVAARTPHAAAPVERTPAELVEVTPRNRMIADPYPRFVVARDQVNQGAAVLMMSIAAARSAGLDEGRWIYVHGAADLRERPMLERPDLGSSPAAILAANAALARSGVGIDEIDFFDLYSCFPIAVSNVADALGLSADDPRRLTVTGGLPFFGGAGNNYSMHAIATMVERLRERPGSRGFVGANGGVLSKYSAAVYSTIPRPFAPWSDADLQERLDSAPRVPIEEGAQGTGTIEAFTIVGDQARTQATLVVRLSSGARTLAIARDDVTLAALVRDRVAGTPVHLATSDGLTIATVTDAAGAGT